MAGFRKKILKIFYKNIIVIDLQRVLKAIKSKVIGFSVR